MYWPIIFREILQDLRIQKNRAFLTTFAIVWGTIAVVLLMAFGAGLQDRMIAGMLNAGNRIIIVYGGETTKKYQGLPEGREVRFIEEDALLLKQSIPEVEDVSPQFGRWNAQLRYSDNTALTYMEGVYPAFEELRTMYPEAGGRFLNMKDELEQRRVLFLGSVIATELFKDEDPIGNIVRIDGNPFTLIGIMQKKLQTSMSNGPDDRRAVIPFSTFHSIYGYHYLHQIVVKPARVQDAEMVKQEIRRVLGRKYRFDPTDDYALGMWDFIEMEQQSRKVFIGFQIFLGIVGVMTLVIAGVGVANIMYVVVKERTREIGIKRAVGAKRLHIMVQFIFESLLIAAIGGIIGLIVSLVIISLVRMLPAENMVMQFLSRPILSTNIMLITVAVLGTIGILAGLFPARRAANVDPVEALRYE